MDKLKFLYKLCYYTIFFLRSQKCATRTSYCVQRAKCAQVIVLSFTFFGNGSNDILKLCERKRTQEQTLSPLL